MGFFNVFFFYFFVIHCLQVNMIKDDGTVIHFNNPKVQASLGANTFAVTGHAELKQLSEMLPGILNQLVSSNVPQVLKVFFPPVSL